MSHDEIALAIGIARGTLEKHFASELTAGAAQKRLDVIASLFTSATKKGNTSAAKAYLEHAPQLTTADGDAAGGSKTVTVKARAIGKKAQANIDAQTAQQGTDWDGLLPDNVTPLRKPAA